MSIPLKGLRRVKADGPPRIVIYGPPKLGKTTLASEFPSPVFLQVEQGTPGDLELDAFTNDDGGPLPSFDSVMEAIGSLYQEEHDYRTVVLDSLDKFEPLLWARVCIDKKWETIETPGYGKGYVEADVYWRDLIEGFNALRRERGMTVILLAHSEIGRFDDPNTVSYSKYDIRLHKRALAIIQDEMDLICLINQEASIKSEGQGNKTRAHAEGGMIRWIFTEARPSFVAGSRYSMPTKIKYDKGNGYAALAQYLPTHRTEQQPAKAA